MSFRRNLVFNGRFLPMDCYLDVVGGLVSFRCEEGRPKAVASSKITELKQFSLLIQMTDPTSRQRGRPTSIKQ
jgi:hypothetical protein